MPATPSEPSGLQFILRCVSGTLDIGMTCKRYTNSENVNTPIGYSDSDWGQDKESQRSTGGTLCGIVGDFWSLAEQQEATVFHCASVGECGVVTVCSGIVLVIDGSSSVKK